MKRTTIAMAVVALACVASLHKHHSISMFHITTPIWVKGVSYVSTASILTSS